MSLSFDNDTILSRPAHPDCIFDRKPGIKIDRIIVHTTEGSFDGTLSWFSTGRDRRSIPTAAHYVIARDGRVARCVPDEKKCYHAGNYNSRSIGIEHEARTAPWAVRKDKNGQVKAPPFPAGDFPDALIASSAVVVAAMCRKFGIPADRTHVIGHREVPGATHTDPGDNYPFEDLLNRVKMLLDDGTP